MASGVVAVCWNFWGLTSELFAKQFNGISRVRLELTSSRITSSAISQQHGLRRSGMNAKQWNVGGRSLRNYCRKNRQFPISPNYRPQATIPLTQRLVFPVYSIVSRYASSGPFSVPLLRNLQRRHFHVDADPLPRPGGKSIDQSDVDRFSQLSGDWWNEFGPMKALHSMNDVRVPWIRDRLLMCGMGNKVTKDPTQRLSGVRILDVGCGAGLLTEPLARLGATVTGCDASSDVIDVARRHAAEKFMTGLYDESALTYHVCSVEEMAGMVSSQEQLLFDAVVASEILEHVASREEFVDACMKCLRPGGLLFITTLNRTVLSRVLGIWAAEQILKIVPAGIHEWDKFTTPPELESLVERHGAAVRMVHGMCYNPLTNVWTWSWARSINYALLAEKLV